MTSIVYIKKEEEEEEEEEKEITKQKRKEFIYLFISYSNLL